MRTLIACAIALGALVPSSALANHSIVPDQFPTIQAAIDAGLDGDTVYVRDGDYPEALSLGKAFSLLALGSTGSHGTRLGVPRVTSVTWTSSTGPRRIRGFRFSGLAWASGNSDLELEGCWFGAGLESHSVHFGHLWNSVIMGDVKVTGGGYLDIAMCAVIGGTVDYDPPGDSDVHDNVVVGPAPIGILARSDAWAVRNYVRGCVVGIQTTELDSRALSNVVEDCSGPGILLTLGQQRNAVTDNIVRRCGRGIDLTFGAGTSDTVSGNVVEDAVGEGILVSGGPYRTLASNTVRNSGGRGIDAGSAFTTIMGNQVFGSAGDGLTFGTYFGIPVTATGNVVGHSAARGIVANGPGAYRSNTSYLNSGDGFDLTGVATDSVDHNIGYTNGGAGLRWTGAAPVMGCNDWFGNAGGATSGVSPAPTDVALDPLFCQPALDDVGLRVGSPLAPLPDCGLVGALDVGCTYAGVPAPTPGGSFGLDVGPTPSSRSVRFAWSAPGGGELAVFDVAGHRRWSRALGADRGELVWTAYGPDGRRLEPGVYFARLTAGGRSTMRRVVLLR